jgi:hypothetical protein
VLAGTGAVERKRTMDQPLIEALRFRHLPGSFGLTTIVKWKLPSPAWPTIGAARPKGRLM